MSNANNYSWHYLDNKTSDYPHYDDRYLVCVYNKSSEQYEYKLAWNPRHTTIWENEHAVVRNVIAWKKIERCEVRDYFG